MTDLTLDGATRVVAILGDPIAQVKSPAGVTRALQQRGRNAVVVPVHVTREDLDAFVQGASRMRNLDGLIVTVPHKIDAFRHCASTSERARFLGAVNVLRRNADGSWHGDHCDGEGFVQGLRQAGARLEGQRALLVGAGGAGSAIALALLDAGVRELAILEPDAPRRGSLLGRLRQRHGGKAVAAPGNDPTGFDLVLNATPMGMEPADPLPVEVATLAPSMFVADVITAPAVTPLLESARARGCATQDGAGMFAAVCERMVAFLLAEGPLAR